MPSPAPGSIHPITRQSMVRRNAQTPTTSCTIRIGNRIAAARTGSTAIASIGSDRAPIPEKPPLARPSITTAGTASA